MMSDSESKLTIYFDGVCNLCNSFVDWMIRHDQSSLFRFTSLQGETAKMSLPETLRNSLSSVVVRDQNGNFLTEARAVLFLFRHLNFPYFILASFFGIFPDFILNLIYQFVAKNRYRLFGKRKTCRMPTEAEKKLFLP